MIDFDSASFIHLFQQQEIRVGQRDVLHQPLLTLVSSLLFSPLLFLSSFPPLLFSPPLLLLSFPFLSVASVKAVNGHLVGVSLYPPVCLSVCVCLSKRVGWWTGCTHHYYKHSQKFSYLSALLPSFVISDFPVSFHSPISCSFSMSSSSDSSASNTPTLSSKKLSNSPRHQGGPSANDGLLWNEKMKKLLKSAQKGTVKAQFELGKEIIEQEGLNKENYQHRFYWLQKVADSNDDKLAVEAGTIMDEVMEELGVEE